MVSARRRARDESSKLAWQAASADLASAKAALRIGLDDCAEYIRAQHDPKARTRTPFHKPACKVHRHAG